MIYVMPSTLSKSVLHGRLSGPPEAREVVSCGGQGQFHGHLGQPAPSEPPHPSLFFQHSDHRLDDRFAPLVNPAPRRVAQFPAHSTMEETRQYEFSHRL
jgi:hypothetical protein